MDAEDMRLTERAGYLRPSEIARLSQLVAAGERDAEQIFKQTLARMDRVARQYTFDEEGERADFAETIVRVSANMRVIFNSRPGYLGRLDRCRSPWKRALAQAIKGAPMYDIAPILAEQRAPLAAK